RPLLGLVQGELIETLVGDVLGDPNHARDFAVLIAHGKRSVRNPADLSVGTDDAVLERELRVPHPADAGEDALAVAGVYRVEPEVPARLHSGAGFSPDLLVRRAHVEHAIVRGGEEPEHEVARGFRSSPELLLADPDGLFGALAHGDVVGDGHDAKDV